ncbi:hypothetical protein CSQ94_04105 [Janthinobacterium sp. BJB312]|nr:hypothetical protein CSQ94_04105 [Janthinobacterium sp. BJB312]
MFFSEFIQSHEQFFNIFSGNFFFQVFHFGYMFFHISIGIGKVCWSTLLVHIYFLYYIFVFFPYIIIVEQSDDF